MTANPVAAALVLVIAYFVIAILVWPINVLFALLALRLRRSSRARRILRCR